MLPSRSAEKTKLEGGVFGRDLPSFINFSSMFSIGRALPEYCTPVNIPCLLMTLDCQLLISKPLTIKLKSGLMPNRNDYTFG